jgi:hypothetical protein
MMTSQVIIAFVFGATFLVAMLLLAIAFPRPTPFQYNIFRVVLSIAAAGVAAMVPGFLKLELTSTPGLLVSAGGALGVFVIVYFFNPAKLVADNASAPSPNSHIPDGNDELSNETLVLSKFIHPGLPTPDHNNCVIAGRLFNKSKQKVVINKVQAYDRNGKPLSITWSNRIDRYGNPEKPYELIGIVDSDDIFVRQDSGEEVEYCKLEIFHSLSERPLIAVFDEFEDWIGQQTSGADGV